MFDPNISSPSISSSADAWSADLQSVSAGSGAAPLAQRFPRATQVDEAPISARVVSSSAFPTPEERDPLPDELVEWLRENGFSGQDVNERREDQSTPLHDAANQGLSKNLKMLLDSGAAINAVDDKGQTPLHRAAQREKAFIAGVLLKRGADVNPIDKDGQTPLHKAVALGYPLMINTLIEGGAKLEETDLCGKISEHLSKFPEVKKVLEDRIERLNQMRAVRSKFIIAHGYAGCFQEKDGLTPLHHATLEDRLDVLEALGEARVDVNKPVLIHATSQYRVWCINSKGQMAFEKTKRAHSFNAGSALHLAVRLDHTAIALWLLEKGALNSVNHHHQTPLYWALHFFVTRGPISTKVSWEDRLQVVRKMLQAFENEERTSQDCSAVLPLALKNKARLGEAYGPFVFLMLYFGNPEIPAQYERDVREIRALVTVFKALCARTTDGGMRPLTQRSQQEAADKIADSHSCVLIKRALGLE